MATMAALEEIHHLRQLRPPTEIDKRDGNKVWRTDFVGRGGKTEDASDSPQGFLIESSPNRLLRTHFHEVDQFQVIVAGDGTLAKHDLAYGGVHFARAFTPYGPIINGKGGLSFLTLRARRDPEYAQFIPECKARLVETKRKPWQITRLPEFVSTTDGCTVKPLSDMNDANGLSAVACTLAPGASYVAPDPAGTDGQYIVVLGGSVVHDSRNCRGLAVGFVHRSEAAYRIQAGAEGARVLVLSFPKATAEVSMPTSSRSNARVMNCMLCSAVYDESLGSPHDGIPAGTRWEDVPESWTCPDCGATKAEFEEAAA